MMLLNNLIQVLSILGIVGIILKLWYKKNGNNYIKDKKKHTVFSILRSCVFLLSLYFTFATLYLENTISKIQTGSTLIYVYKQEDDSSQQNKIPVELQEELSRSITEISEDTYFNKLEITALPYSLNLWDYLIAIFKAPFAIDYDDFYKITTEIVDNTGIVETSGMIKKTNDTLEISNLKLRLNNLTSSLENNTFMTGTIIYDISSINSEGIIEEYIIVGGE